MQRLLLVAALVLHAAVAPAASARRDTAAPTVTYKDDKVSLRANDAPLSAVLDALRAQSGAEVRGAVPAGRKVTADFDAVPTREALERILGTQNFTLAYDETGLRTIALKGDAEERRVPAQPDSGTAARSPSDLAPDGWWKMTALFAGKEVPVEGKLALLLGTETASWDVIIQAGYGLDDPAMRSAAIRAGLRAFESDKALRDGVLEAAAGMSDQDIAEFIRAACRERGEKLLRAIARATRDAELRGRVGAVAGRVQEQRLAGKDLPFGRMPPKGERH